MKKYSFLIVLLFLITQLNAQIVSGPMLGHVELRTAKVWIEVVPSSVSRFVCYYWEKDKLNTVKTAYKTENNTLGFSTIIFDMVDLKYNTTYDYKIQEFTQKKPILPASGQFTTQNFWQYREAVPTVSILAGSCNYINELPYDRKFADMVKLDKPASSYGGDTTIFNTMANTKADAMIWLGDNWYTRESDYHSAWGLNARPSTDRKNKSLQALLKAMPQYAIWDDHDFGPNDCDKSYHLANESREAFKRFWANPSYGDGQKGIYTKVNKGDVDIFLLDDRTWRSNDNMIDSLNGMPNIEKKMFGMQQMDWLKNALLSSNANFKIIATGSQMLNPVSPFDCFTQFPIEYNELMQFLEIEKIRGVLFMTGDRHHTEIIKQTRNKTYPLYDITISPLTSGTHKFGEKERNNPYRVLGIDQLQNFGLIQVTGPLNDRKLTIYFKGVKGEDLGIWSIDAKDLK